MQDFIYLRQSKNKLLALVLRDLLTGLKKSMKFFSKTIEILLSSLPLHPCSDNAKARCYRLNFELGMFFFSTAFQMWNGERFPVYGMLVHFVWFGTL